MIQYIIYIFQFWISSTSPSHVSFSQQTVKITMVKPRSTIRGSLTLRVCVAAPGWTKCVASCQRWKGSRKRIASTLCCINLLRISFGINGINNLHNKMQPLPEEQILIQVAVCLALVPKGAQAPTSGLSFWALQCASQIPLCSCLDCHHGKCRKASWAWSTAS